MLGMVTLNHKTVELNSFSSKRVFKNTLEIRNFHNIKYKFGIFHKSIESLAGK
jgi:hypothetical protein